VYRFPTIFQQFKVITAAESTRHGGVSIAPYTSLNLGLHTEDDPESIIENRKRFFTALNIDLPQVAYSHQIHSDQILNVENSGSYEGYDALITNRTKTFLSVTVADCTPVLIFDPHQKAVAAIHAGWRGTVAEIVRKTLMEMQTQFRTKPEHCFAYVGTCIDECSFEVDADVADHFATAYKRWDKERSKFFIDLKQANRQQLLDSGVPESQIEISSFSTFLNNEDYFSYRKEGGQSGRMLAVIGLQ